jgi:hypothetical protein
MIHLKNYETIFVKELINPNVDMYGIKAKLVEGYPVSYVPLNSVVF